MKALTTWVKCVVLTCGAIATALLMSGSASANFPGVNGRIAFVHLSGATGGSQDIFTMGRRGRYRVQLTRGPSDDAFPNYSPDGKRIVFTRGAAGGAGVGQAWIMNQDGSGQKQLTFGSPTVESTTFSPDGKRIAFTRGDGGSPQLWTMKVDGTHQRQLTFPGPNGDHVHGPTYSPDGRLLAFSHHYGAVGTDYHGISVIRPNGTGEKALTLPSAATDDFQPDFSPNGKRIVFDRYNQVQDDLYVMKANGSRLRALTNTGDLELSPAFSPNGKKVVFERDNTDFTVANVVVVDSRGLNRNVTPLTMNAVPVQDFEPGWQPRTALGGSAHAKVKPTHVGTGEIGSADARPVQRPARCGGGWESYGADLANSRSQHAAGGVSTRSVHRLGLSWAIRGQGLVGGNPTTVTATPAVAGCVAYYGDWRGDLAAVSVRSGRVLWRTQVDAASFPFTPVNSSPAVDRGSVYVSTGAGRVVAVSRRSGRIRWSTLLDPHLGTVLYASPVVARGTLVIGVSSVQNALQTSGYDFRGSVVGLDTRNGRVRWRTWVMRPGVDGPGGSVWSSAAIDRRRQLAYVGTGQAYAKPSGPRNDALLALRLRDGRIAWKRQFTRGDVYTFFGGCCDYDIGASPNLFQIGSRAVVGVGDKAGRYAVLDRETGRTVWRRRLCRGSHLGGVMTTAAVAHGSIWVSCNRFVPAALTPYPDIQHPGNRTDVFALDAATGSNRWRRTVKGVTLGALTEAGGAVFVPNTNGRLRAWSASGGRLLWSRRPGGPLGGGVTVAGGRVLVGYGDFVGPAQPPDSTGGLVAYAIPR